jgi:hypothetical protein
MLCLDWPSAKRSTQLLLAKSAKPTRPSSIRVELTVKFLLAELIEAALPAFGAEGGA